MLTITEARLLLLLQASLAALDWVWGNLLQSGAWKFAIMGIADKTKMPVIVQPVEQHKAPSEQLMCKRASAASACR